MSRYFYKRETQQKDCKFKCEFCCKINWLSFNFLNNEPNTEFSCKYCNKVCGYVYLCKFDNTKSFSHINNSYCNYCSKEKHRNLIKNSRERSRSRSRSPPRMRSRLNTSYTSDMFNTSNASVSTIDSYLPPMPALIEIKNENSQLNNNLFKFHETTKVIEFTKTKAIINNKYKHYTAKITISELSEFDDIMPINCNIYKVDEFKYLIKGSTDLVKEIAEKLLNWKEYDEKTEI
jgi:hypothetical protein